MDGENYIPGLNPEIFTQREWLGNLVGSIYDRVRQIGFTEARRLNIPPGSYTKMGLKVNFALEGEKTPSVYNILIRQDKDEILHVSLRNAEQSRHASFLAHPEGETYGVAHDPFLEGISTEDLVTLLGVTRVDLEPVDPDNIASIRGIVKLHTDKSA